MLTGNFTDTSVATLFKKAGLNGVSGGRFFSNAIDTRSNGVDLVANYGVSLGSRSTLRFTSGYNHNIVKVTHVDSTPPQLKAFQSTLFDRVERTRIEKGNPRDNLFVSVNEQTGGLSLTARTQRYGEVSIAGACPAATPNCTAVTNATGPLDQTFGAKWISDLSASWSAAVAMHVHRWRRQHLRRLSGSQPQSRRSGDVEWRHFQLRHVSVQRISPFGFNGRFVYTKLSVGL